MIQEGVSLVICCHNSADRLPSTLSHIAHQESANGIPWEVVVIDNASTDNTTQVACQNWNKDIPFHVVAEPRVGLSYARLKGFQEARYEFVCFVDDDNWIESTWVTKVYQIMTSNPHIGALGGPSEAVFDEPPPDWFNKFESIYAVGDQSNISGDITTSRGWLWGAGLTFRKTAFLKLQGIGFRQILTDRVGKKLVSGGDVEMCLAIRLLGWRLWYDPSLKLKHFMPKNRLSWQYLLNLVRAKGSSSLGVEPYFFIMENPQLKVRKQLGKVWLKIFKSSLLELMSYKHVAILNRCKRYEGSGKAVSVERLKGRIFELIRLRGKYDQRIYSVWKTFAQ